MFTTDTEADFVSPYLYVCETCRATGAYRREGIPALSSGDFPCDGCKGTGGQTVTRVTPVSAVPAPDVVPGSVVVWRGERYTVKAVTFLGMDHVALHTDRGVITAPNEAYVALSA